MPANTPATSSTDSDPDSNPSLSPHDGADGADGAALSPEAVAEAAVGLAPRSEGHAVEEGKYDASAIQVLEGLEAGPQAAGHVHRLHRRARFAPPGVGGRRQLRRRGAGRLLHQHPGDLAR